jgi:hypothetical protein
MREDSAVYAGQPPRSWFAAFLRLWILRPIAAAPPGNPILAILGLCAAWLILWVALDWWESQPDPQFSTAGIPLLAWYVLAMLGFAAVLRWRAAPTPGFGGVLALTAGLVPFPLLVLSVVALYLGSAWFTGASLLIAAYAFLYSARGLYALTGERQRAAAFIGAACLFGFLWLTNALNAIPDVWNPRDQEAAAAADAVSESEAILFDQAGRIDRALAGMPTAASPKPRAFFLGFAGVGEDKEFAEEIDLASRVLGEKYPIEGRSL